MDRSAVIRLANIIHTTDASGTQHEAVADCVRRVCTVKSIGMKEAYTAMSVGRSPTITATLAEAAEYGGQQYATVDGGRYKIIRTYQAGSGIELTLERTRDLEGLI